MSTFKCRRYVDRDEQAVLVPKLKMLTWRVHHEPWNIGRPEKCECVVELLFFSYQSAQKDNFGIYASHQGQVNHRWIWGIHPAQATKQASEAIHSRFETQGRCHHMSKTRVSIAPQNGLMSFKYLLKNIVKSTLHTSNMYQKLST